MQSKNICHSFFDNKIETFINDINNGNIEKGIQYFKKDYH
jgi:hypothetical protein